MPPAIGRRPLLRSLAVGTAGAAGAVDVVGCLDGTPRPERVRVTEGFETGIDGWTLSAHVGPDAGEPFEWGVEVSETRAADGRYSLAVFTEGDHDDGTAWVSRAIPVVPGTVYDASVSVLAYAESESFNTVRHLVLSLGPEQPVEEADFPRPGWNSSEVAEPRIGGLRESLDLQAGWREYAFEWTTPELAVEELFVAAGVSVVWETDRTDYLDCLRVDLRPRR